MNRFEVRFVAIGWVGDIFVFYTFLLSMHYRLLLHVIFIVSVPLRGDYLKTMFVAVAIDENNQILPIAFGLAVKNNLYCCTWFLMRLREALRQGGEVSFITNMNDVVSSCIEHVFLNSYHGYTSKSMFKYMCTRGVSCRKLKPLFWMNNVSDFEENIHRLTPDAREMLANIGHAKWERAYFPNICWNVVNIDVTNFFLCYRKRTLVDHIYYSTSLTTVLNLYAEMVLHKRLQKSIRRQTTKIPPKITLDTTCSHAIATSCHSNIHESPDVVQIYYQTNVFQTAYQT
uniref:MULE transposase domain-containing protein n=1 Tax=Lactuca sativa TaxID=4236 RepID=A0A9R1X091_LACSA|nr:hypothetical protein LSAT_V11C800435790 [Lactuca sativa]